MPPAMAAGLPYSTVGKRIEANWCSRNVEYIELTVEKDFQQQFMEAMQLPHMTDPFPHLEGIVRDDILHQGAGAKTVSAERLRS